MKRIVILSCSLRNESITLKLSRQLKEILQKKYRDNYKFTLMNLKELTIPRCDGRAVKDYGGDMKKINGEFEKSDGVIICYPVYGQSFTGILKDVLDCTDRLYGKPAFLVQVLATERSFLALENLSNYLLFGHNMLIFPKFLVFNEKDSGENLPDHIMKRIDTTFFDYFSLIDNLISKSVLVRSLSKPKWYDN